MSLTDKAIRAAEPKEKMYRLSDGNGLHLQISPAGGKLWRYRYEYHGKEKMLALGQYPEIGLKQAREARDAARSLLLAGRDPAMEKKLTRARQQVSQQNTFRQVSEKWYNKIKSQWSAVHANDVWRSLERDVFPMLGSIPIADIDSAMVLSVLEMLEKRGAIESAHRLSQRMSAVFCSAIPAGLVKYDPTVSLKKALLNIERGHFPAAKTIEEARAVLTACESQASRPSVRMAFRWIALTAVRPGTGCGTPWSEVSDIDSKNALWVIPKERMKTRQEHIVPLPRQALDLLNAMRLFSGRQKFVFPNARHLDAPITENSLNMSMRRCGLQGIHVPHGWRSTFSTIMNERRPADRYVIDLMLAHQNKNRVEGAYNRAELLALRRDIAQEWADLLLNGMPSPDEILMRPRR
ncbi:tyrosine-type recombinase/integrase [Granulibacter bethesdensis]|uniref:tyrosine-type recombinase/integrase n=1 Tax=Granulibacter bethesdensis TaxID=364410 RepID=UPI0003F1CEC7|nr:integrase arm-type DNA-binding domain-containing protein [Granulibacter bethesdensis]AHJ66390.1 DNA integration/recombination/inversion protein [Granulibacter bethesdensis CGDNIH4]